MSMLNQHIEVTSELSGRASVGSREYTDSLSKKGKVHNDVLLSPSVHLNLCKRDEILNMENLLVKELYMLIWPEHYMIILSQISTISSTPMVLVERHNNILQPTVGFIEG